MDNINLNEKWILKITTDCTKYYVWVYKFNLVKI